jgi:hypothetical protein
VRKEHGRKNAKTSDSSDRAFWADQRPRFRKRPLQKKEKPEELQSELG